MATATAMADRHVVSLILDHLSNMKYQDRRQEGPDNPVEFLEFRPTLIPSLLVNRMWADQGASILWKQYPSLPALKKIGVDRRQWYAAKVEKLFFLPLDADGAKDFAFLANLAWPLLKSVELEADWRKHGSSLVSILHANLEDLEFSGSQSGDSRYITEIVLPALFQPCRNLQSVSINSDVIDDKDSVDGQVLANLLDMSPTVKDLRIMRTNFLGKNVLFKHLSQRFNLQSLEIDLEPGSTLLSFLSEAGDMANFFPALRRLHIMAYPEVAVALPKHLLLLEELSIDIARIPNRPSQKSDITILDDQLASLSQCTRLQALKVNIGQLATNFPSAALLPTMDGASLVRLATKCPQLTSLNLLASEPASLDGSGISSAHFEEFTKYAPNLVSLSLKLHPGTSISLEETALQSLGKHCGNLEVLRLKIALQLPSLTAPNDTSTEHAGNDETLVKEKQKSSSLKGRHPRRDERDYVEIMAFATHATTTGPVTPLFPKLTHFAFACPQTVLSVIGDAYAASSNSYSSSEVDPTLEDDLVRAWAHALLLHFPRLDILEAWGDWTGYDNESLQYFLPLQEPLASTWEFLKGIEQDLWDSGEEEDDEAMDHLADDFQQRASFDSRGSGDWEIASLMNEYPEDAYGDAAYEDAYDEEPEDMITPVDERQHWFNQTQTKHTTTSSMQDYTDQTPEPGV